ncbi:MAG: hypothetical protein AAF194_09510, partial [Pseudomonadota bacterium]
MNIIEMGVSLLSEKLGLDLDPNAVAPALNGLLANDSGELDLAGLARRRDDAGRGGRRGGERGRDRRLGA